MPLNYRHRASVKKGYAAETQAAVEDLTVKNHQMQISVLISTIDLT
ncbi:MAG: hypothetical protein WCP46_01750 [Alphaproteobacteria bacterium]